MNVRHNHGLQSIDAVCSAGKTGLSQQEVNIQDIILLCHCIFNILYVFFLMRQPRFYYFMEIRSRYHRRELT